VGSLRDSAAARQLKAFKKVLTEVLGFVKKTELPGISSGSRLSLKVERKSNCFLNRIQIPRRTPTTGDLSGGNPSADNPRRNMWTSAIRRYKNNVGDRNERRSSLLSRI